MYSSRPKSMDSALPKSVICECGWCGNRYGGDSAGRCAFYCKTCSTAEGRAKIKEENDLLYAHKDK